MSNYNQELAKNGIYKEKSAVSLMKSTNHSLRYLPPQNGKVGGGKVDHEKAGNKFIG